MGVTRRSTRRRVERFETAQAGSVDVGGMQHSCTVRNLSNSGTLLSGDFDANPGEMVDIEVAWIGRITGRIAWREGSDFGIVFTDIPSSAQDLSKTLSELNLPCVMDRRTPSAA